MISPGTGDGLGNRPIGARDVRRFARAIHGAEDPMAMMAAYHGAFHFAPRSATSTIPAIMAAPTCRGATRELGQRPSAMGSVLTFFVV